MQRHGPSSAGGASKSIAAQTNAVGGALGGLGTEKAIGDVRSILQGRAVSF